MTKLLHLFEQTRRLSICQQIDWKHGNRDGVPVLQLGGEHVQTIFSSSRNHQIHTRRRELPRIFLTNPGRRPGDQCPFA